MAKSVSVRKPDPGMSTPALDQHCKVWAEPKPYTTYEKGDFPFLETTVNGISWVEELPPLFRQHGLEVLASDHHHFPDQYLAMWGQSNLAGYLDLVEEKTEGVGDAENIRKIVKLLDSQMKQGASFDSPLLCVVARKAL